MRRTSTRKCQKKKEKKITEFIIPIYNNEKIIIKKENYRTDLKNCQINLQSH